MVARKITFHIGKGGSGKTRGTVEIAVNLAGLGYRVLTVDLDQQADLTKSFGYEADIKVLKFTTYDLLLNPEVNPLTYAVLQTPYGVDLIPATRELRGANDQLAGEYGRELKLKQALEHLINEYDYILIDTPPGTGVILANALVASDSVIVPLETKDEAWNQVAELEELIRKLKPLNSTLKIDGIFLNKVRATLLSREIEKRAREKYQDLVFNSAIPDNTHLAEAYLARRPATVYAPTSVGSMAYKSLTQELEDRYGTTRPK